MISNLPYNICTNFIEMFTELKTWDLLGWDAYNPNHRMGKRQFTRFNSIRAGSV